MSATQNESRLALLERLMGNGEFPWTLTRGHIRMGPSFDVWTVVGRGFGAHQFTVAGVTPDLAVEAAIQHLTGPHDPNGALRAHVHELEEKVAEVEATVGDSR